MESDAATQTFQPEGELTRAELMTVIDRAAQFVATKNYGPGVALTSVIDTTSLTPTRFTDIDGHAAAGAIASMAQLGIALPPRRRGDGICPRCPQPEKRRRRRHDSFPVTLVLAIAHGRRWSEIVGLSRSVFAIAAGLGKLLVVLRMGHVCQGWTLPAWRDQALSPCLPSFCEFYSDRQRLSLRA
jgi:hypothetical protein